MLHQPCAARARLQHSRSAPSRPRYGVSATPQRRAQDCTMRSMRGVTCVSQSALGCRANRVWASIIQFMSLGAIATVVSHVRRCCRPTPSFACITPVTQVFLPIIDQSSDRDVQLGILQCTSLTQHMLTSSLLLVPHLRALCPLEQISEDSFSFWPLMNDVGRLLQRRGVVLRHSDGKCIGVEQFCLKWFSTLFCCCFEHEDLRYVHRRALCWRNQASPLLDTQSSSLTAVTVFSSWTAS
jgi:hypothetical protein